MAVARGAGGRAGLALTRGAGTGSRRGEALGRHRGHRGLVVHGRRLRRLHHGRRVLVLRGRLWCGCLRRLLRALLQRRPAVRRCPQVPVRARAGVGLRLCLVPMPRPRPRPRCPRRSIVRATMLERSTGSPVPRVPVGSADVIVGPGRNRQWTGRQNSHLDGRWSCPAPPPLPIRPMCRPPPASYAATPGAATVTVPPSPARAPRRRPTSAPTPPPPPSPPRPTMIPSHRSADHPRSGRYGPGRCSGRNLVRPTRRTRRRSGP